jgi:hypothetical protein
MEVAEHALKILVVVALALTVATAITYRSAVGVDVVFHVAIARIWASGQDGMVSSLVLSTNGIPYPPLFHWLLVPSVWLHAEGAFTLALQVVLYPLIVAIIMFVVKKLRNTEEALLTGLLLLGSLAFYDRAAQVIPQAIDMLLFPLLVYCHLKDKRWSFVTVASLMIWNHGPVALIFIGGILLRQLPKKWKIVLAITLITLPIWAITLPYLPGLARVSTGFQTDQERGFWTSPTFTLIYLGPMLTFSLLFLFENVKNYRKLDELDKSMLWTAASLLIMVAPWADRFLQYLTIPLALNAARHMNNSRLKFLFYTLVITQAIFFCLYEFLLITEGTYVAIPL